MCCTAGDAARLRVRLIDSGGGVQPSTALQEELDQVRNVVYRVSVRHTGA